MHNSCVAESACVVSPADHGRYAYALSSGGHLCQGPWCCGSTRQWTYRLAGLQPSACDQADPLWLLQESLGQAKRDPSLSCLPGWPSLPISKSQVHKENPAGGAITKLLTAFELEPDPCRYFIRPVGREKAEANTAKVAGATARHCIIIHGESTFLSGEGRNLDCDQECSTGANVAFGRATNLTILACLLNMQGMPGALQAQAALLQGVQTICTYDDREPTIRGSLDLTAI